MTVEASLLESVRSCDFEKVSALLDENPNFDLNFTTFPGEEVGIFLSTCRLQTKNNTS